MAKRIEDIKELKSLDEKGLQARLKELREKLRDLSFRTEGDEIRDVHQMSKVRKQIARILTIMEEKRTINQR